MGYVGKGIIRWGSGLREPLDLFHMSCEGARKEDFWAVSIKFTDYVTQLAEYATWSIESMKGSVKFQDLYQKALVELRKHRLYGFGTNYTEEQPPYRFSSLYWFLKK